jgi:drug/metabolite transporter (DMT)-like permease
LGLTAAIGFALSMMCTKRLTTSEPPLRILFHMFLIQSVIALVLTAGHLRVPDATTCGWIGGLALFGFTAHYALVRAFSLADAIVVAPMDFLRLPLIALVGVLVYQEPLDAVILAGGVLVLVANFINIWVERRARARPST